MNSKFDSHLSKPLELERAATATFGEMIKETHSRWQKRTESWLCRVYLWSVVFLLIAASTGWALPQPADTNYDESKVPVYTLPDPLIDLAGKTVGKKEWMGHRREEILRLFEDHVYGSTPQQNLPVRYEVVEIDREAVGGKATRKQIAIFLGKGEYRLDVLMYVPNQAAGPVAGFLGLNFNGNHTVRSDPSIILQETGKARGSSASRWQVEKIIDAGYALVTLHRDQVDPDNYQNDFSDGVHPLFYSEGQSQPADDQWGSIGAWAWALSRTLDYLETDDLVDASRVAVMGHSRLGKTALWAGAQDPRFAMVISNNSGCGGAALYRRCYGERIHHMVKPIGYWFCRDHHQYQKREQDLPVDQHMLMALIAPRPLYVASATKDRWADPQGEFLAAKYASPVYQLYNRPALSDKKMPAPNSPIHTTVGYHLREGAHNVTAYDWQQYLNFANQFLLSK